MKECKYCADVDTEILYGKPQKILGEVFGAGIFISESKPRTLHCFVGDEYVYKKKIKYCFMCGRKLTE